MTDRLDAGKQQGAAGAGEGFSVSMPSLGLPKGGGAIRGLGEKFTPNPATGTGAMSVPIAASAGRNGFGPHLSLSYESSAGNGAFGLGWRLSLPAITRKTERGVPRYLDGQESDVFILAGAEDLVPALDAGGVRMSVRSESGKYSIERFRPRVDAAMLRIERWTRDDGDVHWRTTSHDNVLTVYGAPGVSGARICDPADPARVFSWLISETRDAYGQAIVYKYKAEDDAGVDSGPGDPHVRGANRYLKRILYGNNAPLLDAQGQRPESLSAHQVEHAGWMFELVFDYGDHASLAPAPDDHLARGADGTLRYPWPRRIDEFSAYRAGFEIRTSRLCRRVLMFHHFPSEAVGTACLVRSTDLRYAGDDDPGGDPEAARAPVYARLAALTQTGYRRTGGGYDASSLPPLEFAYTAAQLQDRVETLDARSLDNLPTGIDGTSYRWTDLHGEGVPGILSEQAGAWYYKANLAPLQAFETATEQGAARFGRTETVAARPNVSLAGPVQLMDLAGDGQPDVVVLDRDAPGLYEHDGAWGWKPFRPFPSVLNRDLRGAQLKFIDLDGDGHADLLITEQDTLVWHAALGEDGYGPGRRVAQALDDSDGPRVVFADGAQSIYLADMSGDGLSDLVRIRNGEVSYWPNLGHGRFGRKVAMRRSPRFDHPDQFDHARIRLADIDGSGTSDLIYLHRDGIRIWFNQCGNGWSACGTLRSFVPLDNLAHVVPLDLLGNGTTCLVWSSPLPGSAGRQLRYINLVGADKPHLLVRSTNNLGAETHIHYAPSTAFYLRDKLAGNPWLTRLPFPVHVVERLETIDFIRRSRFVTHYAYHHGYFDGEEREFRGFGMVEEWHTEYYRDSAAVEPDIPPVHTKTWYHTGAPPGPQHWPRQAAREYFQPAGGAQVPSLEPSAIPDGLDGAQGREAWRALRGNVVRQEVYAHDGAGGVPAQELRAQIPYVVTERNVRIVTRQPRGGNRHAVFAMQSGDTLTVHHEREAGAPRVEHRLTLQVDDYGNVLQEAMVAYGRSGAPAAPAMQALQETILATCTERRLAQAHGGGAVDTESAYRTPLEGEVSEYEITGLILPVGQNMFSRDDMAAACIAPVIDVAAAPRVGAVERRLIGRTRTQYRSDDLAINLPLAVMQSSALVFEKYKLAFTAGLLGTVYQRDGVNLVADPRALLAGAGGDGAGYIELDADGAWWARSGQRYLSPDAAHSPAQELDYARAHFFLPHRLRDPFHAAGFNTDSVIGYDPYCLLVRETRDCLGNRISAGERLVDGSIDPARPGNDYRVLQPCLVTDANGNRAQAAFDVLGMLTGTAVMGKPAPAQAEGDTLDGFVTDLPAGEREQLYATGEPGALLHNAGSRIVYNLHAFRNSRLAFPADPTQWRPASCAMLLRETHHADVGVGGPAGPRVQLSFSYSDGFGREVQKKARAAPAPGSAARRWIGSGWAILNSKGKPVRQFEPFFSDHHGFEHDNRAGGRAVLFYDALERVVAKLNADHSWEKTRTGAWETVSWDANDTVNQADPGKDADVGAFFRHLPHHDYLPTWHALRTEPAHAAAFAQSTPGAADRKNEAAAAAKAAAHADTPSKILLDPLGRGCLHIAHNRAGGADTYPSTLTEFDIVGQTRQVTDAGGRTVVRYRHDMLGNRISQADMDAGRRWMVADTAGRALCVWDDRGNIRRTRYDALRRPVASLLAEGGGPMIMTECTEYGEREPGAEGRNARGKPVRVFDQSGSVITDQYDFKGNLLRKYRRIAREFNVLLDHGDGAGAPALEPEGYLSLFRYDALNRPVWLVHPHSDQPNARVNVTAPAFDEGGLLTKVQAWLGKPGQPPPLPNDPATLTLVTSVEYDAKGQRRAIAYGNGATTTYAYDPFTLRLAALGTVRLDGTILQDLRYARDAIGNITSMRDDAQQTVFFRNREVAPEAHYTYDALYRLTEASGREHLGRAGGSPMLHSHGDAGRSGLHSATPGGQFAPNDGDAMGRYLEHYLYDAVGNLLEMQHRGEDPVHAGWTRAYEYAEASRLDGAVSGNRLSATKVGTLTERYSTAGDGYDSHGCMTHMPHLQKLEWDYADRLRMTQRQRVDAADTDGEQRDGERTWYTYDTQGQRIRKVTVLATGQVKDQRLYLDGMEFYSNSIGTVSNTETLHIMDDRQRIAMVETRSAVAGGDPHPLLRYQLGNQLGSATLELDELAQIISYEEYTPYGSTIYQAVRSRTEAAKRYRYTGKERDEESGFYYHGARYYIPWLARWASCDPLGVQPGHENLYQYVAGEPVGLRDPDGRYEQGGVLDEVLQGGFYEGESTWSGTLINVGIGAIPYVGQAADIRDIAAAGKKVRDNPGWQSAAELTLAVIGIVPVVGDAIKGGAKMAAKATAEVATSIAQKVGKVGANTSSLTIASKLATGNPAAIARGMGELNSRQIAALDKLPEFGSNTIVHKSFGQKDLAALTAATGDEFAMFSTGGRRLIYRGDATSVPITPEIAQNLAKQGWRWSSHVHPGYDTGALRSSLGDQAVLRAMGGNQSAIFNSMGQRSMFTPAGDSLNGWTPW
ncbi:SpvB/TcaC N-terminal domain-containing protein [Pseudoduganella namucuonensis]|uniref:RHS repeat-associated core domain-containing protein n=1 Tax=Pseudoduganella namucuonensis TaxID=1035707 RepID=A0A1I7LXT0_9BURK|nr:SpvB/TcaC N-terminal domain-containing protein [Pseudoduganella namucuonensis]SFV14459.1 RHS repeat-associated core domain-containing protein [Pseudoduganella namucuonensis]